jgi:hypothetical protein
MLEGGNDTVRPSRRIQTLKLLTIWTTQMTHWRIRVCLTDTGNNRRRLELHEPFIPTFDNVENSDVVVSTNKRSGWLAADI